MNDTCWAYELHSFVSARPYNDQIRDVLCNMGRLGWELVDVRETRIRAEDEEDREVLTFVFKRPYSASGRQKF